MAYRDVVSLLNRKTALGQPRSNRYIRELGRGEAEAGYADRFRSGQLSLMNRAADRADKEMTLNEQYRRDVLDAQEEQAAAAERAATIKGAVDIGTNLGSLYLRNKYIDKTGGSAQPTMAGGNASVAQPATTTYGSEQYYNPNTYPSTTQPATAQPQGAQPSLLSRTGTSLNTYGSTGGASGSVPASYTSQGLSKMGASTTTSQAGGQAIGNTIGAYSGAQIGKMSRGWAGFGEGYEGEYTGYPGNQLPNDARGTYWQRKQGMGVGALAGYVSGGYGGAVSGAVEGGGGVPGWTSQNRQFDRMAWATGDLLTDDMFKTDENVPLRDQERGIFKGRNIWGGLATGNAAAFDPVLSKYDPVTNAVTDFGADLADDIFGGIDDFFDW